MSETTLLFTLNATIMAAAVSIIMLSICGAGLAIWPNDEAHDRTDG